MFSKLKFSTKNITKNLSSNMKLVAFEGAILSIFMLFIAILLVSNVLRVIANGRYNYETYLSEKKYLEEIKKRNEELQKKLAYVNSDEFKILILRDTSGIVAENEMVFATKETASYYDEEIELLELEKSNYLDWWLALIQ